MIRNLTLCAVCAATVCACTPTEIAAFETLTPTQQADVVAHLAPPDCMGAVREVWPQRLWGWAERIVWRESRNDPSAQNATSSSAGCFQLTRVHADLLERVGCSWAQRYVALCNVRAAWLLYGMAGAAPWA